MGLSALEVLLVICYIVLSVSGLTFVKLGGAQTFSISDGRINWIIGIKTIIGLLVYVVSFLLYVFILPRFQLSYISPITTGSIYILVMVVSYVVFKERLSALQIAGALMILAGVLFMSWGNNQT